MCALFAFASNGLMWEGTDTREETSRSMQHPQVHKFAPAEGGLTHQRWVLARPANGGYPASIIIDVCSLGLRLDQNLDICQNDE